MRSYRYIGKEPDLQGSTGFGMYDDGLQVAIQVTCYADGLPADKVNPHTHPFMFGYHWFERKDWIRKRR